MICINCGSNQVKRTGDDFTCGKCGYQWDVAHEQASAAYLATQGRTPAISVLDVDGGTIGVAGGVIVPGVHYLVGKDGPELFIPGSPATIIPAADQGGADNEAGVLDTSAWEGMTVQELKDFVTEHGIELGTASKKAEIITVILDSMKAE